ncbi:S8 family serine peptidase [Granulosicoccus antarcticus]|uniref:Alkaline elastase YaB n=1 Tax=Granulosicoccus antarcticus IMCC3135 TaxID=1192854 RepID=A0A2Z2NVC3_9GAMM|nr:S8 family serine peptidase [Granulosicoccus antarcticus]ASJ73981.1 Alkaline elastase YaB [Granulosicoccus antarcticus IMCC3135]
MASRKKTVTKKVSGKKASSSRKSASNSTGKSSGKSEPGKKRSPATERAPTLPARIYAQASVLSIGGRSMFDAGFGINAENVADYLSEEALLSSAVAQLQQAGFDVLQVSGAMINIAGSAKVFEQAFGAPIEVHQREVIKPFSNSTVAEFLDSPNCDMPGLIATQNSAFGNVLEGVALEEPRYYMAPNATPPNPGYWHLDVPNGVSMGCNAGPAHRAGITGRGVVVSMVDSGFYRHPFFAAHGYRADNALLGPGASNAADDESGHGTGESANIFALAPDVRLRPVKMSFVNSIGSFDMAVGLGPDIITCSWGSDLRNGSLSAADIALGNAVATAVASGITVIFSAGNGHWGFPGQHPDVISAGGVFMDSDGSLQASDYSSGFMSNIYSGRRVPDLSGLVGMQPGARYIMLPVQPLDEIDRNSAGGTHPNGDETTSNDGWAAFSGTSAAAPQLAGAAALVKQTCQRLTPAQVRDVLQRTATDVTTGQTHGNTGPNVAHCGVDEATGHGLVNAHRATILARMHCRIVSPVTPTLPPVRPPIVLPILPPVRPPIVQPVLPPIRPPIVQPIQPPIFPPIVPPIQPPTRPPIVPPIQPPIRPIRPIQPIVPIRPIGPVINPQRTADELDNAMAVAQQQAYQQGYEQALADAQIPQASEDNGDIAPLDEADLDELEAMVRDGMIDPGDI